MKTKGINSSKQVDSFKTDNDEQAYLEMALRRMIISCFTYGGYKKDSFNYNDYIKPYESKLGKRVFNQVYNEQVKYLEKNCSVNVGVYTDSEGLTYNSLIEK